MFDGFAWGGWLRRWKPRCRPTLADKYCSTTAQPETDTSSTPPHLRARLHAAALRMLAYRDPCQPGDDARLGVVEGNTFSGDSIRIASALTMSKKTKTKKERPKKTPAALRPASRCFGAGRCAIAVTDSLLMTHLSWLLPHLDLTDGE